MRYSVLIMLRFNNVHYCFYYFRNKRKNINIFIYLYIFISHLFTYKKSLYEFFKEDYTHTFDLFYSEFIHIDIIHDFRLSFALLHLIVIARSHSIYDIEANCLLGELNCMSLFEKLSNAFLRDSLDVESTTQLS